MANTGTDAAATDGTGTGGGESTDARDSTSAPPDDRRDGDGVVGKIKAGIDLDADAGKDFTIAGMGPLQTVLVFVILMFLIDVVFNGGAVTDAIVRLLTGG